MEIDVKGEINTKEKYKEVTINSKSSTVSMKMYVVEDGSTRFTVFKTHLSLLPVHWV